MKRTVNDLQVMAFRLGITPEEMTRIAEATSWEAVERAVARRALRRNDYVQHIASGAIYRVKVGSNTRDSTILVEELRGFRTWWGQTENFRLVAGAD